MSYLSRLTTKSQITVPKNVRQLLGVRPGQRVRFEVRDGKVELAAEDEASARRARIEERLKEIDAAAARFAVLDQLPGMSGLEYQRMMRGDGPEV